MTAIHTQFLSKNKETETEHHEIIICKCKYHVFPQEEIGAYLQSIYNMLS